MAAGDYSSALISSLVEAGSMRNALVLFVIAAGSCGLSGCQTVYNILAPTFTVLSYFSGNSYDDESSFVDYGPSSEEIRQHRRELAEMREADQ